MADAESIKDGLRAAFRDYRIDGVPASGANDPDKAEIRPALLASVDLAQEAKDLAGQAGTTFAVETVADLSGLNPTKVGDRAEVRNDPAGDVEDGNGVYSWDGSAWVWISDLIPASVQPAVRLITDGQDSALVLKDARGRVLRAYTQDGGERGALYSIVASDRPGVRVVDARGRAVTLTASAGSGGGSDPGPDPVVDPRPYVGPALYGVQGEPVSIVLDNVLADRQAAQRCLGMILPVSGRPVVFRDQAMIDGEAVGGSLRLLVRAGDGEQIGESGDIEVRIAANPGAGSPIMLTLGDSIAYRGGLYWQDQALTSWGYTPDWVGTLTSRGATDDTGTGGKAGEVKPGHELGDFTYQTTATVQPLPVGQEAAYAAMGVAEKRLYNTLLRAPSGDPAGDVVNGQVIDFGFYFTRHELTPATLLQLSLWTNDITVLDEVAVYDRLYEGYSLLFRRWRAYHPTHPIVIALPGTARTPAREAFWPRYIAGIRAVWQAVVDFDDPNIHLVPGWAQTPADGGYDLTPPTETPDPLTGAVVRTIQDGVHPTGAVRVANWRLFAAGVAFAHTNII